jgi:hypothetical protein
MGAEIIPIMNEQGEIVVHDKYVDGRWVGSRRTLEQAENDVGLHATIRSAKLQNYLTKRKTGSTCAMTN